MKHLARTLFVLAFAVMTAGAATCYFGIKYEIAQIPAEQRARMTDTDWIGVEPWGFVGLSIMEGGAVILAVAIAVRVWQTFRESRPSP